MTSPGCGHVFGPCIKGLQDAASPCAQVFDNQCNAPARRLPACRVLRCALSDSPEQRELVRLLIQRMAYEQEVAWLDAIIQVRGHAYGDSGC